MNRFLSHEGKTDANKLEEKYSETISKKPNHMNFV